MYHLELKQLHADNAVSEALRTIETICDEYRLEEQFGILSLSVIEMLTQMMTASSDGTPEINIDFFIDNSLVTVHIQSDQSISVLAEQLQSPLSADTDNSLHTILGLVDQVTFKEDENEVILEYFLRPQPAAPVTERAETITEQEQVVYKQTD